MQPIFSKKTKIVATLGPSSNTYDTILAMVVAGANVFRLNFSHGSLEDKVELIRIIREINQCSGSTIPVLADLQGPKLRIGKIKGGSFDVVVGDVLRVSSTKTDEGSKELLGVLYPNLEKEVKIGHKILIDDGKIETRVSGVRDGILEVTVTQGGTISSNKGFNLPDTKTTVPALTQKDIDDLDFIVKHNLEWVALSFVRDVRDITLLRNILIEKKSNTKIIAKIEKPEALESVKQIINAADGIMIARGDLGVEVPIERVPLIQKDIIQKCIHRAKPVIVATQMMESMMHMKKPSRSDTSDVANAVIEGTDAVMLSAETAVGDNPVQVIEMMHKIIMETERVAYRYDRAADLCPQSQSSSFLSDAICYNACKIAKEVSAKLIVGMTQSGLTGFTLSAYRPSVPMVIFANNPLLVNQLALSWGVRSYYFPQSEHKRFNDIIEEQVDILKKKKILVSGDVIVTTGSIPASARLPTNMFKIHRVL